MPGYDDTIPHCNRNDVIEECAVMVENEVYPGEPSWNQFAQVMAEKLRALKS